MKVIITGKNFNASDKLEQTIEKKFEKLGKYFSDDIKATVMLSQERGKDKVEATINAKGTIFRAEERAADVYEGIDRVVEKLSSQMSRFKGKLQKRYNDNKTIRFEYLPDVEEQELAKVAKKKKFQLQPMTSEEAIVQMEMLQHNFFVYLDVDTDSVNVVYKRTDKDYGILETVY
ncbi:MAG TPA: ribosome-associated translation inhibitor RaiA [Anaerovoracaceae bacterium]|nr:ribosome-associated translation inhibitor RaiA [Anaerovoracaceae bacterium]